MALLTDIKDNFSNFESYQLKMNQENFLIKFKYSDRDFTLTIDKDFNYTYLNSDTVDTNLINIQLMSQKNIKNIIKIITDSLSIDEEFVKKETDYFGIFREREVFNKGGLDYDKLRKRLEGSNIKSILSITSIPSNLLYSRKQIIDILINEIKKVNSNKTHPHYIKLSDRDYTFEVTLCILLDITTKKYTDIKLEINVDPDLHPYYPPSIKYISPDAKQALVYQLSNLNILKIENWNPIIDMDWLLKNISDSIRPFVSDYILSDEVEVLTELDKNLIELSSTLGEKLYSEISIDITHSKFSLKEMNAKLDNKYWKSGVGYGYSGRDDWDIKSYIKEQGIKNNHISTILNKIISEFESDNKDCYSKIMNSSLMKYLETNIVNSTLLEIDRKSDAFMCILDVLKTIYKYLPESSNSWRLKIHEGLERLRQDISPVLNNIEDIEKTTFYVSIITMADFIKQIVTEQNVNIQIDKKLHNKEFSLEESNKIRYTEMIKLEQENMFNGYKIQSNHRYSNSKNESVNPKSLIRISAEFSSLRRNLPNNWDTSIIVRACSDNLNLFSFVITGPKDTPYHNGIFEFHAYFPKNFPNCEPKVLLDTTGGGTFRFNPNLYDCGKVCLSLLGTWSGQDGESWNKDNSTFLQVLVSIQSLILVERPYFNEPGWEREMHTEKGKEKSFNYNDKIRYGTFKWAIVDKFENPAYGFENMTREHFLLKKEEILKVTNTWVAETKKYETEMKDLSIKLLKLYAKAEEEIESVKTEEKLTASEEKLEVLLKTEAIKMVDKLVNDSFDKVEKIIIPNSDDDSPEEIFLKTLDIKSNIAPN